MASPKPDNPGPGPGHGHAADKFHRARPPTLYDAVAGLLRSRVPRNATGAINDRLVLPPDEAVFRARNAPLRFEETDRYFAHESLPPATDGERVLPDSDLLAAVHRYASVYYEGQTVGAQKKRKRRRQRTLDERSMDETALLAMGILLEEACRELLGRAGELVFTEGGEEGGDEDEWEDEEEDANDGDNDTNGDDGDDGDDDASASDANSANSAISVTTDAT